jgi:hypothetical protein
MMAAMRRVSQTLTYPATTVDDVFAMLADPAYRKAVGDDQRVTDFSCRITPAAEGTGRVMTVRLEQAHGVGRLPSFAQRMVGDEIRFVQEESWTSTTAADLHVRIPGKPGEMSGTTTLRQVGADVVQQVELAVKVSIPLVGGKMEELVAEFVGKAYAAENQVGVRWLGGGS